MTAAIAILVIFLQLAASIVAPMMRNSTFPFWIPYPQQIAVIDTNGFLQWVNRSWKAFSEENGGPPNKSWRGTNYLNVCHHTEQSSDQDCGDILTGMEKVIKGEEWIFYFEYPCHSPTEQRWFMMRICPLDFEEPNYFLVTHENITDRKLMEMRIKELTRTA